MNDIVAILSVVLPVITAFAGWIVGKRKSDNDFLHAQKESISELVDFNRKLIESDIATKDELMTLREQNAQLRATQATLKEDVARLQRENAELRKQIAALQAQIQTLVNQNK